MSGGTLAPPTDPPARFVPLLLLNTIALPKKDITKQEECQRERRNGKASGRGGRDAPALEVADSRPSKWNVLGDSDAECCEWAGAGAG